MANPLERWRARRGLHHRLLSGDAIRYPRVADGSHPALPVGGSAHIHSSHRRVSHNAEALRRRWGGLGFSRHRSSSMGFSLARAVRARTAPDHTRRHCRGGVVPDRWVHGLPVGAAGRAPNDAEPAVPRFGVRSLHHGRGVFPVRHPGDSRVWVCLSVAAGDGAAGSHRVGRSTVFRPQ